MVKPANLRVIFSAWLTPPRPDLTSSRRKALLLSPATFILFSLLMAQIGLAARNRDGYPAVIDPFVNDFARLLTTRDKAKIQGVLTDLKTKTGIAGVVVTIRSIHDYQTGDQTLESFATNLFNTWGIGDRWKNNGVLILVAVKDRRVRIETGAGYGKSYNAQMQSVISEEILPSFRKRRYSHGILEGTTAVAERLAEGQSIVTPTPTTSTLPAIGAGFRSPVTTPNDGSSLGGWIILWVLALGLAALWLLWYSRSRPLRCSACRTAMHLNDESSREQFLDTGQKIEVALGSVNYQIWQCAACGQHLVRSDPAWSSRFVRCNACSYLTLDVDERVTIHPTYSTHGAKRVNYLCRHCGLHEEQTLVLPMLSESTYHNHALFSQLDSTNYDSGGFSSSSTDSSSFSSSSSDSSSDSSSGGGSSSGDGASGSW